MRSGLKTLVLVATTVAAVALLAGSCASTAANEPKKDEWTGHKIDEAIAKLGTPSEVTRERTARRGTCGFCTDRCRSRG